MEFKLRFLTKFMPIVFLIFFLGGCPAQQKKIVIERIVPTRTGAGDKVERTRRRRIHLCQARRSDGFSAKEWGKERIFACRF